jgi:two-component system cell cycle sensor histidine kinase/response regulator CckA
MTGIRAGAFRVLIVDDEGSVREFTDRVLRDAGYTTTTAGSGREALAVATASEPFDLLLADVMMPEMRGDELAAQLRQAQPDLKVLYLTGFSDNLFTEKITLWEGEAFLEKPSSIQGLLEAVSLLLFGRLAARAEPSAQQST